MDDKKIKGLPAAKELLGSLTAGKAPPNDEMNDQTQASQREPGTHQADQQPSEPQPAQESHPGEQPPHPAEQPPDPQPAQEQIASEQPPESQPPQESLRVQVPEQTGNGSLPSPDKVPDEDELDDDELELSFTDQDRTDLPVLEAEVTHYGLKQAKAIRAIRNRKLWMLHRDDDGRRKYKTYDNYVKDVHGRSRQWASEQTQWLATIEKLAELRTHGVDVPEMLSRNAVSGLHSLPECGNFEGDAEDEQEEAGLIAVLGEAAEDGMSLSHDNLRAICSRRYKYFRRNKWQPKPLAASYAVYKKDLALLEPLANVDHSERLNSKIEKWVSDHPSDTLPQAVVATYKQHFSLPSNEFLLSAATGDELVKLVADLVALSDKITSSKEAEKVAKESREKARQAKALLGIPKSKNGSGKSPTPANPEAKTAPTAYTVELTGKFAEILDWSVKDDVCHEDLLNLFQTLTGQCSSPITEPSSIKVVPVAKVEEGADDDFDEYEPEEVALLSEDDTAKLRLASDDASYFSKEE